MSDAPDQQQPDSPLAEIVDAAEKKAENLKSNAQEIVREAQHLQDVAKVTKAYLKAVPEGSIPSLIVEDQKAAWGHTLNRLDESNRAVRSAMPFSFTTSATTMLSTSGLMGHEYVHLIPPERREPDEAARRDLHRLFERQNLFQSVELEISRLGLVLDMAQWRTALELLRQAQTAFAVPSSNVPSPDSILIPLREAIEQICSLLLQRRQNQEPASNDRAKIESICSQMGSRDLRIEDIERLVIEFSKVKKNLSDSKQRRLTREQIQERLNEGLLFLQALLRPLDRNRMR